MKWKTKQKMTQQEMTLQETVILPAVPGIVMQHSYLLVWWTIFLNCLEHFNMVERDNRRCYDEDICTARRNCWDGEGESTSDTESFDLNDIEDQDQNPVLVIEQQMLESVAQSLGEPVSAFLTSDEFTSVAPDSVQDDGSSCAGVVASIGIVLLAVLMALMN